jgi:hypothetical protein
LWRERHGRCVDRLEHELDRDQRPQAIHSTIAGPTAVAGATNVDPLFVNPLQSDYHLASGSPAIDQVDSGPPEDLDNTARPQGSAFDLGAYEYKP